MKCSKGVFGAGQACQAMGNLYHDACFTCAACSRKLRGKAFYFVNGKVFCEEDFLVSLSLRPPLPAVPSRTRCGDVEGPQPGPEGGSPLCCPRRGSWPSFRRCPRSEASDRPQGFGL